MGSIHIFKIRIKTITKFKVTLNSFLRCLQHFPTLEAPKNLKKRVCIYISKSTIILHIYNFKTLTYLKISSNTEKALSYGYRHFSYFYMYTTTLYTTAEE